VFVKICGITNPADAESSIAAGADALGFNFWPGSERFIEPDEATEWISELPDTVSRVAVLVNPTLAYAKEIAGMGGIDLLQLHGAESPDFCLSLIESAAAGYRSGGEIWRYRNVVSMELGACPYSGKPSPGIHPCGWVNSRKCS
jgi:phosphoribosylanthranilate isomerase